MGFKSDFIFHYGVFHSVFHYGYFSAMFYTMGSPAMFYTMGSGVPVRARSWFGMAWQPCDLQSQRMAFLSPWRGDIFFLVVLHG
jgi:hypothetical protein